MCFRRATPVALPRRIPKNAFQTCNAFAAALADGGDRTHTLLPVLDFESSASANSATSAFCEEATTNPFAPKRKRQRRHLATLKQTHPGFGSVQLPNKRARLSTDRHPGTEYSIPPNPHVFLHSLEPRTRSGQNEPS